MREERLLHLYEIALWIAGKRSAIVIMLGISLALASFFFQLDASIDSKGTCLTILMQTLKRTPLVVAATPALALW